MKSAKVWGRFIAAIAVFSCLSNAVYAAKPSVRLQVLGTHATGFYNQGAAEIVAHDPVAQRLFVVNAATSSIDILDVSNPSSPELFDTIDLTPWGDQANSVDVHNGIVAAAVQAEVKTDNGRVVFFDADGNYLNDVPAGALPDMLTFTPNGQKVLVANEGEPNSYDQLPGSPSFPSVDPEGSVTIVDLSNGVLNAAATQVGFTAFNSGTLDSSVRIYGPNASRAQDFEPEYIAVDHNSKTAWVTLQENNAIAILDIKSATITEIVGLGFKNHNLESNKFDASDRDVPGSNNNGIVNIRKWPVFGMYEPDAISTFKYKSETFLITANEGDTRQDWPGFAEEIRVGSLALNQPSFADQGYPDTGTGANGLRNNDNLGRLTVSIANGNLNGGSDYEELYLPGARSFSIWNDKGELIFDSGDDIEQITAEDFPSNFNANHSCDPCLPIIGGASGNEIDNRSDNKGPEPESVTVGKAYGRTYAFIGLERISGVMVYDVSDPYEPIFVQYINNRNFLAVTNTAAAGDLGPEGIHFISAEDSPTGVPLIAVANEISGTTSVYELVQTNN